MGKQLKVSDLRVRYGPVVAVDGVSVEVDRNEIVSVVGANGAGKSTLLNSLMGLVAVDAGTVEFDGHDVTRLRTEDRLELGLCLVPENRELFVDMTVFDNLVLGAYVRRLGKSARKDRLDGVFDRFPRLAERREQLAGTLSGGERQMLVLGRALMSNPKLLMLDEPSLGLAPLIVNEILSQIRKMSNGGMSVLLIEQNARAALRSSDRGYVLERGQVTLTGEADQLMADDRVRKVYLGIE